MNQNKLLYCRYITCNTNYILFFSYASVPVGLDVEVRLFGKGCVNICGRFTNKLCGWGKWVLCSLWLRLSWILRLPVYNLIFFTYFCLQVLLTIFPAKHNTTIDHVMTRPLIWRAFTSVALCICIHWVPADTLNVTNFFIFLSVLQVNSGSVSRKSKEGLFDIFLQFLIVCQLTDAM